MPKVTQSAKIDRSPGPNLCSRAGRGHFPATGRSEATGGGGRGESPPPAHLPGPRALRLRWPAGRLCPRPRKPPAPPAAAEASQRLRIATAPPLPPPSLRCSRAAPARRPLALGRDQLLADGGGITQHPPKVCGFETGLQEIDLYESQGHKFSEYKIILKFNRSKQQ